VCRLSTGGTGVMIGGLVILSAMDVLPPLVVELGEVVVGGGTAGITLEDLVVAVYCGVERGYFRWGRISCRW